MSIIDLTFTYQNGQTVGSSKNHPVITIKQMAKYNEAGFNTSSILLGSHIGTHMDAPLHMLSKGDSIEHTDLACCIGPVTIVDFRHLGKDSIVSLSDVQRCDITERMLFIFGWNRYFGTPAYTDRWPHFSPEAADYLYENGMRFMAMDTPSPDPKASGNPVIDFPVHRSLLNNNIIFVESLANTDKIIFSKQYSIIALPLKLDNCDGSPCRVILQEI